MRVAVALGVLVGVVSGHTGVRTWEGDVTMEAAPLGWLVPGFEW
jgi:hypothetical protein